MATVAGTAVRTAIWTSLVDPTQVWDQSEVWRLPAGGDLPRVYQGGAVIDQIGASNPETRQAQPARSFSDDWYDRIHIIPAVIDVGNMAGSRSEVVEVWNAYRNATQYLAAITSTGVTDGITLTEPQPAPTTFGILESRIYGVDISIDGPATIDVTYTFDFPADSPQLKITGRRVITFDVPIDWSEDFIERLEWLTDITRTRDGAEWRRRLRRYPRRRFEFDVLARDRAEAVRMDAKLHAWQSRLYAVPVWTDAERTAAAITAGSTALTVDTTGRDYHAGGIAILMADDGASEIMEINTVSATGITLRRPLEADWPAGVWIAPARTCYVEARQRAEAIVPGITRVRIAWRTAEGNAHDEIAAPVQYDGHDVLEGEPDRREALDTEYLRHVEIVDYLTGGEAVNDPGDTPATARAHDWLLTDRQQMHDVRGWWYRVSGRFRAFIALTWGDELELRATIGASAQSMTIRDIEYRRYYLGKPGRGYFALQTTDGTWYYRRITGASQGATPGEEVLTFDAALGVEVGVHDVRRLMLAGLHRLDADSIEVRWRSAGHAVARVLLRGIRQ